MAANRKVIVGPGGSSLTFQDTVSGTNTSVISVGDTITWEWEYVGISHSSTSGPCAGFSCNTDGTWDSGLLFLPSSTSPHPTFSPNPNPFNNSGIFDYFCEIHGPGFGMRGRVIVLAGPEFFLQVDNTQIPPPPIPIITVPQDQVGTFTGSISGFAGYNSPVTLSCQNGSPRVPGVCPAVTVTPDGNGSAIPFNLAVSDSTPGAYTFDIVATGPNMSGGATPMVKSQRVQLNVAGLMMSTPTPGTLTTIVASPVQPSTSFQLDGIGGIRATVMLSCDGLPAGSSCSFSPNSQILMTPDFPQTLSQKISVFVSTVGAASNTYPVQIQASTVFSGVTISRSQPLTVRVVPADHLRFTGPPTATVNTQLDLNFQALDGNEFQVDSYGQTVHLTSTDPNAILPPDYTFITQGLQTDHGMHTFSVTLKTLGPRIVTATDLSPFAMTASTPVIMVLPGSPANNTLDISSDHGPGNELFFRNDTVNFDIKVSAASTPSGKVHLFDGLTEITPPDGLTLAPLDSTTAHALVSTLRLSPGGHPLTVVYDGDGSFAANVSTAFSQPRSPAPRCVGGRCPGSH